jgi:acyl-CoA synthetase (AMP-forming)/AMP-acid ligase II
VSKPEVITTSPYAPIEAGGPTLPEAVLATAARVPDRPALVDGPRGRTLSYAALAAGVEVVAAGLGARGFAPGDVLAVWAPNAPEWAVVALGAMAAGGAVTGISTAATERELAGQVADAGPAVLATSAALEGRARAAGVREVVVLDEAERALAGGAARTLGPIEPGDLALLPYSSGTTGLPKGVRLTHSNVATAVRQTQVTVGLRARDTVIAVMPFCHIAGFVIALASGLAVGATVVTVPRFEPEPFLGLLEAHRVTVLPGAPPLMAVLAAHPAVARHDLSALELIVSGGAPLDAERQRAVAERFPSAAVGQGYGLTETAATLLMPDRARGTALGSAGRLAPSTEMRVVDPESGRDVAAGEAGELLFRGPQVMAGYLGRPDATAAMIDAGGWLHSGDLGRVDADGNVFVIERLKELIKVNALQVAPAELEALLVTHPAVADAAVLPRPDARCGEVPVAVVAAAGALDPGALMSWVAQRVAPHKRIRDVRIVDAIPRGPSGKILRRALAPAVREAAVAER